MLQPSRLLWDESGLLHEYLTWPKQVTHLGDRAPASASSSQQPVSLSFNMSSATDTLGACAVTQLAGVSPYRRQEALI
eukprot:6957-Amphidinium_carterae.1